MKKLMIIAAIAFGASCTHASMVYWQMIDAAANTYFASAQDLNGMTAYLVASGDWDKDNVATSLGKAQASAASSTWTMKTYDSSTNKAQFNTGVLKAQGLSLATGTGDFYIVLADDSKYWASDKLTDISILADGDISTSYKSAKVQLANATALTPSSFTAVPEPTSGLLLLLGLGGLALRRKRA